MTRQLTEEQLRASAVPTKPLKVIRALAGTGKTTVVIEMITRLLEEGVTPNEIALVSFSKSAVSQLQSLARNQKWSGLRIKTLHSLCIQGKRFKPLKNGALDCFITPSEFSVDWEPHNSRNSLAKHLDSLLHFVLPSGEASEQVGNLDKQLTLRFVKELRIRKETTYNFLLWRTLQQLQEDSLSAESLLPGCKYLISDEYQDVSPLQHALFLELARGRSFTVVGDPWQSIYSFQGGRPHLMKALEQRAMAVGDRFELTLNFRCPAHHLMLANHALQISEEISFEEQSVNNMEQDLDTPELIPTLPPLGRLEVHHFVKPPYRKFIRTVRQALSEAAPDQVALLVRGHTAAAQLTEYLRNDGLRVKYEGEISDKSLDPNIVLPLLHCIRGCSDLRSPGPHPLTYLKPEKPLWPELSTSAKKFLRHMWGAEATAKDVERVIESHPDGRLDELRPLVKLWYKLECQVAEAEATAAKPSDWAKRYVDSIGIDGSLRSAVLKELEQASAKDISRNALDLPSIEVLTIHKAKGREWTHVFLWEEQGLLPSYSSPYWNESVSPPYRVFSEFDTAINEREEARLRYVALTRSTQNLVAFIGKECSEVYSRVFNQIALAEAGAVTRLFAELPENWCQEDKCYLLQLMKDEASPLRRYAEDFWPYHADPEAFRAAVGLVQAANIPLPVAWTQRLCGEQVVFNPKVRRIPLRRSQDYIS